jgi:hypothetical protein
LDLIVVIQLQQLLLVRPQHVLHVDAVVVASDFKLIPQLVNLLHYQTGGVYLFLSWEQMSERMSLKGKRPKFQLHWKFFLFLSLLIKADLLG